MTPADLDPFAQTLISAYHDAAAYSTWFMQRHGTPPNTMSKAHHLRCAAQVGFANDDRYKLQPSYLEFGRVAVADLVTGQALVLRSEGALAAEDRSKQGSLLEDSYIQRVPAVELLVINAFTPTGLRLAVAGAVRTSRSNRIQPAGPPVPMGLWPYGSGDGPPGSFDQGSPDPFVDLGDLDLELGDEDYG